MVDLELLRDKRSVLELRNRVFRAVRSFLDHEGFIEVQTPLLTPAPAPELHIDAVPAGRNGFLITSPELYMKRLLAAGYERIYQFTPVFRAGERGRFHHPEFTLLEWYRLGVDYTALQDDCRGLLEAACLAADRQAPWGCGRSSLEVLGDWQHFTVKEAFSTFAGWEPTDPLDEDRFNLDMVEKVEPRLGFPIPCILTDYPASQAALARLSPLDPAVAERFELYWGGIELANGFSELTDPREQRARFEAVIEDKARRGRPVTPLPVTFLESLSELAPCAGIALGIDRLVMILARADHIDQVVAFPPEETP
jgi:elongation factor P--(R)-beta-lysine ligase